jgi:endonuclease/exonuclease/phosphatase (EEP) superfamily protein YafD
MRQASSTWRQAIAGRRPATPAVVAWFLVLTSCASHDVARVPTMAGQSVDPEVAACQASLRTPALPVLSRLDATSIRLLNWNVQKNKRQHWQRDFAALSSDSDLVLVQEASIREDSINSMDPSRYWSFAPGYTKSGAISGVLTMSRSQPTAQCSFVTIEPLLRTPKATSITQYGLTSTDDTLVVVNIHAINFSMGLGAFEHQFNQVREVLEAHDGPIILSGDFNTWRSGRARFVDDLAQGLGLKALEFVDDNRVTRFGHHIDYIYVRGLSTLEASTEVVDSSDHNPMSVTLRM